MRKRLISICIIGILVCCIHGCVKTDKDIAIADAETAITENISAAETETGEEEKTEIGSDADIIPGDEVFRERIEFEDGDVPREMQHDYVAQVRELGLTSFEDYVAGPDSEKESCIDTEQVISDFLQMDAIEFQEKYDRDELYQSGILYCGQEAWKTHIDYVEEFQHYTLENITAIRFYKEQPVPVYMDVNINDQFGQCEGEISIDYHTDYAVTIYSKPADDGVSCIQEISFVKIELYPKQAPQNLYDFMETNYYYVLESLADETWISSPDGDKAACISNGELPKYAAQIYIRQGDDKPFTVSREDWELGIVGWIDNDHLLYYQLHMNPPVLVHLERNEIEKITEERKFDTDGVKYSIQGNDLVAIDYNGEQVYQWQIQEKDGEIYVGG